MSYNGSGTFVINSSDQPVVSGTTITSTAFNALTADLATGLSTAITKDGQTIVTANIPFGGYKLTNIGAPTVDGDALRYGTVVPVPSGGSGVATITGMVKGNGASAFTAGTAGTDYVAPGTATTFTATQTFNGSSSTLGAVLSDAASTTTISATAATGTVAYYPSTQSILYYTTAASANWIVNIAFSAGTTLNTALATGQSITVAFLVTQGSSARYNTAVQIDGTTRGGPPVGQGGAPTSGTANGVAAYTYTVIKTGSAAFTVLATLAQFST